MADKKISALTAASTPLAGTEVLPIVQSGSTVKVSVDNLTTGKTVSMNQINLDNSTVGFPTLGTASGSFRMLGNGGGLFGLFGGLDGGTGRAWLQAMRTDGATAYDLRLQPVGGNVRVGTGNVIVETAGKGIDFSANGGDVLSQYDEGSWTVKLFDAAGGGNQSATTVTGYYTRVGNLVHCAFWGLNNISTAGMTAGNVLHIELPFTASATGSGTGSFASENITFNGRDNATPAVPVGYNRAILRAYGTGTSSASVLVSNVGASANIDYFSMTYRV